MAKGNAREKFNGIFWIDNKIATANLTPGKTVYDEKLIKIGGKEYRLWDGRRSKPSAAIYKGLKKFPIRRDSKILYLGIASGTTASHFSDIIEKEGVIYGVEISERVLREIIPVAKERGNIVPILADARKPETYYWVEQVDVVYADVAVPDMSEVLIRNCKAFLKEGGYAVIAIKSRSIDVTENPKKVYERERRKLERVFKVLDLVTLEPYERDHCLFVLKFK